MSTISESTLSTSAPVVAVDATNASTSQKKQAYVSRFAVEYQVLTDRLRHMDEQHLANKKAVLLAFKDIQIKVTRLEKEHDKVEEKKKRRARASAPSQSFVGVNLPKRVHPELLKLFNTNRSALTDELAAIVKTFMNLNQVNRCMLHLAKAANVVVNNKYNFHNEGAKPEFVADVRRLLIDLCPENFYKEAGGPIKIDELVETRNMSRYLNHLLTRDEESTKFVEALIAKKVADAAASASASESSEMSIETTETTTTTTSSSIVDVSSIAAPIVAPTSEDTLPASDAPPAKKRKLARKADKASE